MSNTALEKFADEFGACSVQYRDEVFKLRAGGTSHHYIDARVGLSHYPLFAQAAHLMLEATRQDNFKCDSVAGIGVGGLALVSAIGLSKNNIDNIHMIWGNDKIKDTDPSNGYGLHGAKVKNSTIWAVDDTVTTGDSIVTLVKMIRESEGTVTRADVLIDRSAGKAKEKLIDYGIDLHAVLQFDEERGILVPSSLY